MGWVMSKSAALSPEDLDFLKNHTDFDEDGIMEWHEVFNLLCPRGLMSRIEFMEKYEHCNSEWFCDNVFTTDTDINFREFLLAIDAALESFDGSCNTPKEILKFCFKICMMEMDDSDGVNDMISIKERITYTLRDGWLPRYTPADVRAEMILKRVCSENYDFYVTEKEFL